MINSKGYVLDANVLIDYARSELEPLRIFSKNVSPLAIPTTVLNDEVKQISPSQAQRLSIELIEPSLKQATEASNSPSFYDALCLIIARDDGWGLVTNDTRLRRGATSQKIALLWGLKVMLILVEKKLFAKSKAIKVAEMIKQQNHYITAEILEDFIKLVRSF